MGGFGRAPFTEVMSGCLCGDRCLLGGVSGARLSNVMQLSASIDVFNCDDLYGWSENCF